ncbi:MAG: mechanosensitive ion channel, partial [Proteobacteria bacterium]|nr:mechanosensitive ion channel [Pseudomonadota bacterium]
VDKIEADREAGYLSILVAIFLALVAGGLLVEYAFRWATRGVWNRVRAADPERLLLKLGFLMLRIALDMLSVFVFFASVYGIFLMVEQGHEPTRTTILAYLKAIVLIRLAAVMHRFVLAPRAPSLRLFDISTHDARALYGWVMAATVVLVVGFTTRGVVSGSTTNLAAMQLLGFIVSGVFILLLIGVVWRSRQPIAALIQGDAQRGSLRSFMGMTWHLIATAYLAIVYVAAVLQSNLTGQSMLTAGVGSLIVIALLPVMDSGVCKGFGEAFGGRTRHLRAEGEIVLPNYEPVIRRAMRSVLIVMAAMVMAGLWNVPLFAMAQSGVSAGVIGGIATVGITSLIAYVMWQAIKIAIDRKLILDGGGTMPMDMSGEGGGASATSRISTLLPLIRSTLLGVIIVMAVMIGLSSLGVNIGPLIAGAGIVGIAVGFGAQTLVRDIVSGIFFLWDDAFRVGEYVELGFVKGTVEGISVRSMRLRHHRGALHTVPYGEIKHLTNHSRDWVIMKLEFRVTYDADIARIKKIFKVIGAEIEADEEMGPNLLQPLKSQGVLRMEDSAMIVRAKFMAKPGEQFVIRREVYTRVQKAFQEAGIEFAHRRVTIDVPKGATDEAATAIKERAAAAIATEPNGLLPAPSDTR